MKSPRVSVQSKGPRSWLVKLFGRPQAEKVHRDLREKGFRCTPIEAGKRETFEFMAFTQGANAY